VENQDGSEVVKYKASGIAIVYFEDQISTLIIGSKKPEELLFKYKTGIMIQKDDKMVEKEDTIPLEFEFFRMKATQEKMKRKDAIKEL
jgi:hypothetical protein